MRKVDEAHAFLSNPVASGQLGDAALATLEDAAAADLLDPHGIYLGALSGEPLFYSGGAHLLTYARTGAGKGRDAILPNLAHVRGQSLKLPGHPLFVAERLPFFVIGPFMHQLGDDRDVARGDVELHL